MSLGPQALTEAAGILIGAREAVEQIAALPAECRPADVADGYAIADRVTEMLDYPVSGWKIGCTAIDQQRALGVDEPFSGRLYAPLVQSSPAIYSGSAFAMRGIEVEFAFRFARDVPPRATSYTVDEVADAVATLHPGIEIVCSRFQNWLQIGVPNLTADNGVNGGFVFGPGDADWRGRNLAAHRATLTLDGKQIAEGIGERVLGNPLNALTWLANHLSVRKIGLKADDVVTTGTCLGIHFVEPGAELLADFGDLGTVELRFTS
ncbi:MAG: hydratase [Rhodospirillaceae bacterium]|nr:hydratase [Rhodospirillaceae bacterium]